ncbi:MAG TPA: serpin family protein [Blastocatellia bacterium]|nr:serpin family protein [Blastocatellia bacterium]
MKSKMSLALCALLFITCRAAVRDAGHNGDGVAQPTEITRPSNSATMKSNLAAASNAFGFDLFQQLRRQDANKSVFFSPLSVTVALAMTYNGAAGETKNAMARALKIEGMSRGELNHASHDMLKDLKGSDPKIELAIANSLWARSGVRFNESFLADNRAFYSAEISTLDFSSPQAAATINRWVSDNTKGKISKIIDTIDPQKVMFLINAVYFKGQWQKRFEKTLTKEQPFYLPGGQKKPMPMMAQSGNYLYHRGDKFQAVSLPYGEGGVSLYLFLPDKGSSLDEFLKGLSFQKWEGWINNFNDTPGDVKLPRFKLDYEETLNDSLSAVGMGVAFNPREADFSGIRPERDLFISEVKHKAVVEVNEEGTEAAAATSVGVTTTSIRQPRERFSFVADRPFLMAIRDSKTGAILFMGAVMEPK